MVRVLLIEDEALLRQEIVEWLGYEGFDVLTASDGVEGANVALEHGPDVIISDIMLPRMDGHGVLLTVRSNPKTQLTPFIFMTAKATQHDVRAGMQMGADDYITKPFTLPDLVKAIQTQLDKRAAHKREIDKEVETWRQALEQEHEMAMLKTRMVAMFSHDFRNPLAAILSSIALVRDYADRMDKQHRLAHLNRAESAVRQLLQMLDDMLFLAQSDTGTFNVRPEQVDVGRFIENLTSEFQHIHHDYQLECRIAPLKPITVDPRLIRQIAANLISNAVKYSSPGAVVQIAVDHTGDAYLLTVKDEGIGIPPADQARLFNAFQRGSNVQSVSGTGLGLAIVQQATDLLGGSIHLQSDVGMGTTISVSIPVQ